MISVDRTRSFVISTEGDRWGEMEIASASCASFRGLDEQNSHTDDRAVVVGNLVAVFDGASSIDPTKKIDGLGCAEYISEWSAAWLRTHWSPKLCARDYLIRLNEEFASDLELRAPEISALGSLGPAATVTMVSYDPARDIYSYAHVGDTSLYVKEANGGWRRVTRDLVAPCARVFREQRRQIWETDRANFASCALEAEKVWRRTFYNTRCEGSFGILNGDPAMNELIHSGEISAKEILALILMSDGAEYPAEGGVIHGASLIEDMGAHVYIERLVALYDSDPDRKRFPRSKHTDDATVVFARRREPNKAT